MHDNILKLARNLTKGVKDVFVSYNNKRIILDNNRHQEAVAQENNRHQESMTRENYHHEDKKALHEASLKDKENTQKNTEFHNAEAAKFYEQVRKDSDKKDDRLDYSDRKRDELLDGIIESGNTRITEHQTHTQELLSVVHQLNNSHISRVNDKVVMLSNSSAENYFRNDIVNRHIESTLDSAINNLESFRKNDLLLDQELSNLRDLEAQYKEVEKEVIIYEHEIKKITEKLKINDAEYEVLKRVEKKDDVKLKAKEMIVLIGELNNKKAKYIRLVNDQEKYVKSINLLKEIVDHIRYDKETNLLKIRAAQEAAQIVNLQSIDSNSISMNNCANDFQRFEKDITPENLMLDGKTNHKTIEHNEYSAV